MIKMQLTMFDKEGHYKPISTIVEVESMDYYMANKNKVQSIAIQNICHNRCISFKELQKQGYTTIKVREYDKEKIMAANKKKKELEIRAILKRCKNRDKDIDKNEVNQ